jgi:hypothetical protein
MTHAKLNQILRTAAGCGVELVTPADDAPQPVRHGSANAGEGCGQKPFESQTGPNSPFNRWMREAAGIYY